jgi:phosphatidylserine/phosphatidylglycerophosphate/cardiolipin synthase-like enzyme
VPAETACTVDSPRTEPLQVWVLPEADSEPFVQAIAQAQDSIRVMVYEMADGPILDALEERARSGVHVRVILDVDRMDINQPYYDRLRVAGARVHWSSPRFQFMHAKTLIVDRAVAMISTGNYGASSLATERNYVARDADPADVAALVRLFDGDWRSKKPDLRCTRLIIAPDNARERLLALIDSASATLDIESMELSDDAVSMAVAARAAAGVAVRVILADPAWVKANHDAAAFLAMSRIPVKYLRSPAVHVKSILVDGRRAYLGSENLSHVSLSRNREIGLIASEKAVLETMSATFADDWARATSFTALMP